MITIYDSFNVSVTYETAPDVIKEIIDKHEDNGKPLQTMTCVTWEEAGDGAIQDSRYIMLFKVPSGGFQVCEVWLKANDTIRHESEVFISTDEADVFAEYMKVKQEA